MKKILTMFFIGVIFFSTVSFGATVTERSDIKLVVNGKVVETKNVPIIVNSRTLIPLRDLVTNLGVPNDGEHIIWDSEKQTVIIKSNDTLINLTINSDIGLINGEEVALDAPAIIYNNSTYIPARFIGEALNKKIGWDAYESRVLVRDIEVYNKVKETLTLVNSKMKDIQKMRVTMNVDIGYLPEESLADIKTHFQIDIPQNEFYCASQVTLNELLSTVEQYWKDGKCYSNSENGEWKLVLTEEDNDITEYTDIFANMVITDETIYDALVIDNEKGNDSIFVITNDLNYKGLIQQCSDMQLQVLDNDTSTLVNIKELKVEYFINKITDCIECMTLHITAYDEEMQKELYFDLQIIIEGINEDFEVYCPII